MGWSQPSQFNPHPSLWGGVMEVHNSTHQWKHQFPPSGIPYNSRKPRSHQLHSADEHLLGFCMRIFFVRWILQKCGRWSRQSLSCCTKFVKILRLSQSTPYSPVSGLGGGRRQWHYVMGNSNFMDSVLLILSSRVYIVLTD